jgi:AAA15 family ATPase/GTPase
MVSLLMSNKTLRSAANDLFSPFGLRLGLRPHEHKIEVIKDYEDIIVSHPYALTSDTLLRLVFYLAAILTNKDSVLVFEEPESHAFPYYTGHLAEVIALDDANNQYFITTHNPYLLLPMLEKTPEGDLAVFLTYFEDYETKVKSLTKEDLQKLFEIDVFSNLETFLEG